MKERQYEKLIVWQEAHAFCLLIYEVTAHFPSHEQFGLVSQMRRASYSIPTNLAEGNSRMSKKEKGHFVNIATGSLDELHYQCRLAHELGYIQKKPYETLCDHVQRIGYLLHKLHSSLQ